VSTSKPTYYREFQINGSNNLLSNCSQNLLKDQSAAIILHPTAMTVKPNLTYGKHKT